MIDRLFLASLTFCVLLGGTLAVGTEMFTAPSRAAKANVVHTLPRVVVVGTKLQPAVEVVRADAAASGDTTTGAAQQARRVQ